MDEFKLEINCVQNSTKIQFKELLVKQTTKMQRYHYFITGSVGVGKSSVITTFMIKYGMTKIKTCYIREYIDYDSLGAFRLSEWIKGRISLLDFQLYILNCFEKQLNTKEYRHAKFVIWERHPLEALKVFCPNLSAKERIDLENAIRDICYKYEVPPINDHETVRGIKLSTYNLASEMVADMIYIEMIKSVTKRKSRMMFIYLYIPEDLIHEQQKRIMKRGRQMEVERYKDIEQLREVNERYITFINTYVGEDQITGTEI